RICSGACSAAPRQLVLLPLARASAQRARSITRLGANACPRAPCVAEVVIFCVPASDGNGGDVGTGGPHRRTLIVTAWMGEAGGPLEDDADAGGHT
ncbi:unnamed protein product, partial [Prorocentrum cordatum]